MSDLLSMESKRAELERIRIGHGKLTPTLVVAESEPEDALLHPVFEWDDSVAGHQFRLMQGRTLIRAVTFVPREGATAQRVYVHIDEPGEDEGVYEPMALVVRQPDRFVMALVELRRRVESAKEAFDELRAAGEATGDRDRLALIALAAEALTTATAAVQALH